MTTDQLLAELGERGLSVVLKDGLPRLCGDRSQATPPLLAVLRWHREEIVRRLNPPPPKPRRQWLWRDGHRHTEDEAGTEPDPVGAWWWRHEGETAWRVVEARVAAAEIGPEALSVAAGW